LFAELVCAPTATLHASRTAAAADIDIRFMTPSGKTLDFDATNGAS
jgi:hypothetical protein